MARDRRPGGGLRLVGRNLGRLESGNALALKFYAQHPLDSAQRGAILWHHQAQRLPGFAHPGRPADPMDVGFRLIGQVEVDHVGNIGNVEPARRDVGGD